MDLSRNKLTIIVILVTLLLATAGVWFFSDKNGLKIFSDTKVAQSSSSAGVDAPVQKQDIDFELDEIDKSISDINPDDLKEDLFSDNLLE